MDMNNGVSLMLATRLLNVFSSCPKCGNDKIGNGAGKLVVDNNIYKYSCGKCGYSFVLDIKESQADVK